MASPAAVGCQVAGVFKPLALPGVDMCECVGLRAGACWSLHFLIGQQIQLNI